MTGETACPTKIVAGCKQNDGVCDGLGSSRGQARTYEPVPRYRRLLVIAVLSLHFLSETIMIVYP